MTRGFSQGLICGLLHCSSEHDRCKASVVKITSMYYGKFVVLFNGI